jgi:3-oxosteroid 1-dehydrogenase
MWVDKQGKRFVNEASSYMELGEAMYKNDAVPAFAVFDDRAMRDYAYGTFMPGTKPVKKWLESGFLVKAVTIEELARKAGIDPAGLAAQVERYNRFAQTGIDVEFHKGERQYDRFRGDPTHKPNPCVGAISKAPFYATRIFPGDVGTFGGVVTDEKARVLRPDGSIIEGLYATGNCTSSVMGRSYPGPGASISPAFAFGYIAAKDVVGKVHNLAT